MPNSTPNPEELRDRIMRLQKHALMKDIAPNITQAFQQAFRPILPALEKLQRRETQKITEKYTSLKQAGMLTLQEKKEYLEQPLNAPETKLIFSDSLQNFSQEIADFHFSLLPFQSAEIEALNGRIETLKKAFLQLQESMLPFKKQEDTSDEVPNEKEQHCCDPSILDSLFETITPLLSYILLSPESDDLGVQNRLAGIHTFLNLHPWAKDDPDFIFQCFDFCKPARPWSHAYENIKNIILSLSTQFFTLLNIEQTDSLDPIELYCKNSIQSVISLFKETCKKQIQALPFEAISTVETVHAWIQLFPYQWHSFEFLYEKHLREKIPNLSQKKQSTLQLRRVDVLRILSTMLPWSPIFSMLDKRTYAPIFPLSLSDFSAYQSQIEQAPGILVNLSTEESFWILRFKEVATSTYSIFLPAREDCPEAILALIDAHLKVLPEGTHRYISLKSYTLSGDNLSHFPFPLQWHVTLFSRILPFCLGLDTAEKTIEEYRHTVPLSLLLESTLLCAYPSIKNSRQGLDTQFSFQSYFSPNTALTQTWCQSPPKNTDYLDFSAQTQAWSWHTKQEFLRAIEVSAIQLEHTPETPTRPIAISLSPKKIPKFQFSSKFRPLSESDLFNILLLSYRYAISRLECTPFSDPLWQETFQEDGMRSAKVCFSTLIQPNLPHTFEHTENDVTEKNVLAYMLDNNKHLKTVSHLSPDAPAVLKYAFYCAAKNRFWLENSRTWESTGVAIYQLFLHLEKTFQEADIPEKNYIDFFYAVTTFTQAKEGWYSRSCRDEPHTDEENLWKFMQIAQMGFLGTRAFLDIVAKHKNPCVASFDITCQTMSAVEYLQGINGQFSRYKSNIINKLTRVNLLLPYSIDLALSKPIIHLMHKLDEVNTPYLCLYSMNYRDSEAMSAFLNNLLSDLKKQPIYTFLRIPILDRSIDLQDQALCKIQTQYREIQNIILNYHRARNSAELPKQTARLKQYTDMHRQLSDTPSVLAPKQTFVLRASGNDPRYIIDGHTHAGVQQAYQQSQEKQTDIRAETTETLAKKADLQQRPPIPLYTRQTHLWSRDNIDELGKSTWEKIPKKIKEYSGNTVEGPESLKNLFSLWVGSSCDAPYVIKYIEEAAATKIMPYANQFRFGVSYEHLPAGFFIEQTAKNEWILCFNRKKEQQDLEALAQHSENSKTLSEQHAFQIVLHQASLAEPLLGGDDRQFHAFIKRDSRILSSSAVLYTDISADEAKEHLTCLRYLENTPLLDAEYLEKAKLALSAPVQQDDRDAQTHIQHAIQFPAQASTLTAKTIEDDLYPILKRWATQLLDLSPEKAEFFISTLFDAQPSSLIAFGQLIATYDVLPLSEPCKKITYEQHGSYQFIRLAHEIYMGFGGNYFSIWCERLLKPSQNWCEHLYKEEVNAVVESLCVLNQRPLHSEFWWRLVDAHGDAVHHLRYAALWRSCLYFFQYLDKQQLCLSSQVLEKMFYYLQQCNRQLHAQVWLSRVYSVLTCIAANTIATAEDVKVIQQFILDNLHQYAWHHNGILYAIVYEGISYFGDPELFLLEFKYSNNPHRTSYKPILDSDLLPEDLLAEKTITFHYLAHKLSQFQARYKRAKLMMNYWFQQWEGAEAPSIERLAGSRLIFISFFLKHTVNSLKAFSQSHATLEALKNQCQDPSKQNLILWLSHLISLDNPITAQVWPIYFQYLPSLIEALSKTPLTALQTLDTPAALRLLSAEQNKLPGFTAAPSQEIDDYFFVFQERMQYIPYFSLNLSLFEKFLTQVAIPHASQGFSIENFIDVLIKIHNKRYYNELGQVLGLLIQCAKTQKTYYSLPVLQEWLQALLYDPAEWRKHYPIHLLQELLNTPSPLLKAGLFLSTQKTSHNSAFTIPTNPQCQAFLALKKSTLPKHYIVLIARFMLREGKLAELAPKVQEFFGITHDKKDMEQIKTWSSFCEKLYHFLQQAPIINQTLPTDTVLQWFTFLSDYSIKIYAKRQKLDCFGIDDFNPAFLALETLVARLTWLSQKQLYADISHLYVSLAVVLVKTCKPSLEVREHQYQYFEDSLRKLRLLASITQGRFDQIIPATLESILFSQDGGRWKQEPSTFYSDGYLMPGKSYYELPS
ncbi:MAG: hypothetical protein Q8R79_01690, partial [Legionellaceae bacterium]|nr:hypothetical protein [Legionellaceae bacterium]